jgi:hypothetical protein
MTERPKKRKKARQQMDFLAFAAWRCWPSHLAGKKKHEASMIGHSIL